MGQRATRRARDRHPEERSAERPRPATPADDVLALQRAAGNQAVSALLARAPAEAAPADAKAPAVSGSRAVLSGIGTIALLSLSLGTARPGAGAGGGGGAGRQQEDVVLSSRMGKHTAELSRAAREGTEMKVELILGDRMTIVLEGAIVSGYSTAGHADDTVESWTLNFRKMTVATVSKDQDESGEAGPGG